MTNHPFIHLNYNILHIMLPLGRPATIIQNHHGIFSTMSCPYKWYFFSTRHFVSLIFAIKLHFTYSIYINRLVIQQSPSTNMLLFPLITDSSYAYTITVPTLEFTFGVFLLLLVSILLISLPIALVYCGP